MGAKSDRRLEPPECPLLLVSVFNGIGGAFRLYDVLGLKPAGRISIDISRAGKRVTRSTWPDTIELHDVELITRDEILRWAHLFLHIEELHLFAGFPCIHLSSVRAYRRNLDGEGSRLFWKLLEIMSWVQEIVGEFTKVKFCVENVASMDEEVWRTISDHLHVCPIRLEPADILPVSRPRFAWCSECLYEMEGLEIWREKEYFRAYASGEGVSLQQWIRPGWSWNAPEGTCFPTFMKSIRRNQPPPQPAGYFRARSFAGTGGP